MQLVLNQVLKISLTHEDSMPSEVLKHVNNVNKLSK